MTIVNGSAGKDLLHRAGDGSVLPPGYTDVPGVTTGDDTINGLAGDDIIYGDLGNDVLAGGLGADQLDGGAGIDRAQYSDSPAGLTADLQFAADNTGVAAGDTYVSIENLTGSNFNDFLSGNGWANTIHGSDGNDILVGRGGADVLDGDQGDDVLVGGLGNDVLDGGRGRDTADYSDKRGVVSVTLAGAADATVMINGVAEDTIRNIENLTGGTGNDSLIGDGRANVLDGGRGADTLIGGAGTDTYFVDNVDDTVVETAGGGRDTVQSSVTYSLGDEVENLTLLGDGNLRGTGNALVNTIIGNAGNNALNGLGGADRLYGGAGNDAYYVDNLDDKVVERADGGKDRVYSSVSYTLSAEVEDLYLACPSSYSSWYAGTIYAGYPTGTGNNLDNEMWTNHGTLNGGAGNDILTGGSSGVGTDSRGDILNGGDGNDILVGGGGSDHLTGDRGANTFKYTSASDSSTRSQYAGGYYQYDWVTDFKAGIDHFDLWTSVTGVDPGVTSGGMDWNDTTDSAITTAMSGLLAHHASTFTPDAGTHAGRTFLVVDTNGVVGYQSGYQSFDLMVEITGFKGVITTSDFI